MKPKNPKPQMVRTTALIEVEVFDRVKHYLIEEYKRTNKRLYLKDILSSALDLYIIAMKGGRDGHKR